MVLFGTLNVYLYPGQSRCNEESVLFRPTTSEKRIVYTKQRQEGWAVPVQVVVGWITHKPVILLVTSHSKALKVMQVERVVEDLV